MDLPQSHIGQYDGLVCPSFDENEKSVSRH